MSEDKERERRIQTMHTQVDVAAARIERAERGLPPLIERQVDMVEEVVNGERRCVDRFQTPTTAPVSHAEALRAALQEMRKWAPARHKHSQWPECTCFEKIRQWADQIEAALAIPSPDLRAYVRHLPTCRHGQPRLVISSSGERMVYTGAYDCTCGLSALLGDPVRTT